MATETIEYDRNSDRQEDGPAEEDTEEMLWHGGAAPPDDEIEAETGGTEEIPLEQDRRGQDEKSPRYGDSPQDHSLPSAGLGGIGEGSTR